MKQMLYYSREGKCAYSRQLPDSFNVTIRYISVDSDGRLILTSLTNERRRRGCIVVLDSDSALPELVFGRNDLVHPDDRAICHNNNFYVLDDKKLKIFDKNGNFTKVIEARQVNPNNIHSLTIHPMNDFITACSSNQQENCIQIFTTSDYSLITSLSTGSEVPTMAETFKDCDYEISRVFVVIYDEVERFDILATEMTGGIRPTGSEIT
jgi:WD40 repeat protein